MSSELEIITKLNNLVIYLEGSEQRDEFLISKVKEALQSAELYFYNSNYYANQIKQIIEDERSLD